jgi:hypothetical protein
MDGQQFDQLAKAQVGTTSRRRAIGLLVSGALAPVLAHLGRNKAAAACRGFNQPCGKNAPCCPGTGIRCENGHCRCREGKRHCEAGPVCQDLAKNPAHCGGCGHQCPPHKPCCIDGTCRPKCGASCCANCFIELLSNGVPKPNSEVCCRSGAGKVCSTKPGRADDRCCYPDEVCLKSGCCSTTLYGETNCKGKCCAKSACCNGGCCGKGYVCARKQGKRQCVRANRLCTSKAQCFANEICHGGKCCSGNRICLSNVGADPFCCKADEYCELVGTPFAHCTPVGQTTSTYRGHRIRP